MKLKPIINKVIKPFIKPKEKPYTLVSKELGLDFNCGRRFPELLSFDEPATVDVVVIASTKDFNKTKTITTFRDKAGNIIERAFESIGFNLPDKREVYKKIFEYDSNQDRKIVKTFENLNPKEGIKIWQNIDTTRVFKHRDCGKVWLANVIKVSTKEKTINEPKTETHFFANYYPKSARLGSENETKTLTLQIEKDENMIPQIVDYSHSDNFVMPKNDEYLAFRAYDAELVKKPITRYALKKFGLKDINIYIEDRFSSKTDSMGSFSEKAETIYFNYKTVNKKDIIDTAFHEAKHAFQYAAINFFELCENVSHYTKQCLEKLKWKKTEAFCKRAEKYYEADKNYVLSSVDYQKYRENLLEREAFYTGEKYAWDYLQKAKELANELPGIFWHEL